MRTQLLPALTALLVCGVAFAQAMLPAIEVRAGTSQSMMVSCTKPESATTDDIKRVLSLEDADMTRTLHHKFIAAVSDACKAGVAHIKVASDEKGNVTWKKAD
jgi:hypothetical protein